jgi:hypothetical protein
LLDDRASILSRVDLDGLGGLLDGCAHGGSRQA